MLRELKIREYSKGSICLSVVSHDQDDFVDQLLTSIDKYCRSEHLSVIVTRNTKNPSKYALVIPLAVQPYLGALRQKCCAERLKLRYIAEQCNERITGTLRQDYEAERRKKQLTTAVKILS